ncbi:outer membrane beta-barrel protein [Thalassomonas sp. M1454]|uniref:outer membrane beta-barrel protein n=1 Tax=Thalassomonas sp. M1454 TaxID=2594477 RepID=UPI00117FC0EB|nr:outer membrane beta-barrel protein [Thalassomonas sp. M1454]TRX54024.1 outer membrane beta-barrel protein [Thalassomonas sp. M1454]
MKKLTAVLPLIIASSFYSTASLAESPSWNKVEQSYVMMDVDKTDIEASGYAVNISKLVSDNIFAVGGYLQVRDDIKVEGNTVHLEYYTANFGLGYRSEIFKDTDIFVTAEYVIADLEARFAANSESVDDSGYALSTGFRSMIIDDLEANVEMRSTTIDDETDTQFGAGIEYFVTENLSIGLNHLTSDDFDTTKLSVSINF